MASHGFWSLGADNTGANPGSQSPSTSEWRFVFPPLGERIIAPALQALPEPRGPDLFPIVRPMCRAVKIASTFLTRSSLEHLSHYLINLPVFFSQGLVPSGGPEITCRNWIKIMWYVCVQLLC